MNTARKHGDSELPDGWRMVRLGDVCGPPEYGAAASAESFNPDLPRYVRITDISDDGRLHLDGARSANPAQVKGFELNEGDFLFARSGSVGRTYLYRPQDGPCVFAGYLIRFKTDPKWLLPGYLNHFTHSASYYRWVSSMLRVGAQPNINASEYSSLTIPLPPLPEQRAIADVLDSIDDAIERTEAVIAATETLRDTLLHELLTRGVPGWHTEWKDVPGIGTIPADWEVVRLGEVATVERGKFAHRPRNEPKFYGGDIPFIQTSDVVRSVGVIRSHSQTLNELGLSISRLFPVGTVVITIAANIGETAITAYPVAFPDSLVGITPTGVDGRFLEYFLRTQKATLQRFAPESAQKNINLEDLRPMFVPIPSANEQAAIAEQLGAVEEHIDSLRALLVDTQTFKDATAEELLSGWAGARKA